MIKLWHVQINRNTWPDYVSLHLIKKFNWNLKPNRRPLACESDVLTTTLSDLVEKRGSHRHLYSRFAHCQFKEELVVHSRTKTLKKPARNKSMNIPMWTFKVFNNWGLKMMWTLTKSTVKMWTFKIFNNWGMQMTRTLTKSTVKMWSFKLLDNWGIKKMRTWQNQRQKCGLLRFSIIDEYKW
mgnify:CR=1 FL=1